MRRALAGLLFLAIAIPASAADTCHGERVTISGSGKIAGTPGKDVILGSPKDDEIAAGGGEDVVCGGGGTDRIDGGPGRDELDGQDASDSFVGRDLAQDVVTGGVGDRDVANYERTPAGVRLDLGRGLVKADGARHAGGILGIEVVRGSAFADTIAGSRREERIAGFDGDDVIATGGGGGIVTGDGGVDTLTYASADGPVSVYVSGESAHAAGEPTDEFRGFEAYVGTPVDDRLRGGKQSERLEGGRGDDTLHGGGEGDNLLGGPGDDTLFPGPGDDFVDGGANGPVRATGAPGDLVSYAGEKSDIGGLTSYNFEVYLGVNGFLQNPAHAEGVGYDLLVEVESARAPDVQSYLEGDEGPNVLIGGRGIDVIEGLGGNDLLFGLGANDSLGGGDGDDYLDGGKGDSNKLEGGDGEDTCVHGPRGQTGTCESTADD
jgi:Ca2+-binding RTX toxin-like protein